MQTLFDFLNHGSESKLASSLRCNEIEIQILQTMLEDYFLDIQENSINVLIKKIFSPGSKSEIISYLPHFKHLLEIGYITESSFPPSDHTQAALLEILYLDVSLSSSFLRLVEGRDNELEEREITPYDDPLEYLKDQFLRISLLQKLAQEKPLTSHKTHHHIKNIEDRIQARLKITKTSIPLHKLISEQNLNPKEEILFFALLKEEYSGGNENLHDMNRLIELISQDEYDKIKNRALLDDHSTLLEKKLLDYDELINPFGGFSRTFYIREEVLQKIIHPKSYQKQNRISLQTLVNEQEIFELLDPKVGLESVIMPQSTREIFNTLLHQATPQVASLLKSWGIKDKKSIDAKIIFYGASGTGKTYSALALAKSLKRQVLSLDCSKVLSMYVGESEKNVRKIFDDYKNISKKLKNPPVLLLDEADQFLSLRGASGSGAEKMHNQMQNIFLEQIEKFEGILVATTNLIETIDSAFSRRFDYKIEFRAPNEEERRMLWEHKLPKNAHFKDKNNKPCSAKILARDLASYPISGAQIVMIVKNTAYVVALKDKPIFTYQDFIRQIQKELRSGFDGQKNLGFMQ